MAERLIFESGHRRILIDDETGDVCTIGAGHTLCADLARELEKVRGELATAMRLIEEIADAPCNMADDGWCYSHARDNCPHARAAKLLDQWRERQTNAKEN